LVCAAKKIGRRFQNQSGKRGRAGVGEDEKKRFNNIVKYKRREPLNP